jgi:hypothetical protein
LISANFHSEMPKRGVTLEPAPWNTNVNEGFILA